MNKHDIELPPLHRPQVPLIDADIDLMDIRRLADWCEKTAKEYALAAIEADRLKREHYINDDRDQPAAPDVSALVEALEAALMVMTSKEVRLEKQADAITMVRSQLARLRDAASECQAIARAIEQEG